MKINTTLISVVTACIMTILAIFGYASSQYVTRNEINLMQENTKVKFEFIKNQLVDINKKLDNPRHKE